MKLLASHRWRRRAFLFAAALGLALSAATAARAFTFEDQDGSNGTGRGFTDLQMPGKPKMDAPDSRFNDGEGRSTIKNGNGTLYFGSQRSFDQRYNPDRLFDPFARDGR